MYSNISGHTFIKNEERLGSGEGERGGASYERGRGSEIYDDILGRGSELFHLYS